MNAIIKTNSVSKVIENKVKNAPAKKVVSKRKPQTEAQKLEAKKKRIANPQSSHLASNVAKAEKIEFKFNAKANLVEAKRLQNKVDLKDSGFNNLADLLTANKVINAITKKPELIELSIKAVRQNSDKSFGTFYFNQLAQGVVKLLKQDFSIQTALLHIANIKKAKAKAKKA
tara:strand:- start:260 stop:775 length:516 start_codon:yes stop_codon:yes gene_type:complete